MAVSRGGTCAARPPFQAFGRLVGVAAAAGALPVAVDRHIALQAGAGHTPAGSALACGHRCGTGCVHGRLGLPVEQGSSAHLDAGAGVGQRPGRGVLLTLLATSLVLAALGAAADLRVIAGHAGGGGSGACRREGVRGPSGKVSSAALHCRSALTAALRAAAAQLAPGSPAAVVAGVGGSGGGGRTHTTPTRSGETR